MQYCCLLSLSSTKYKWLLLLACNSLITFRPSMDNPVRNAGGKGMEARWTCTSSALSLGKLSTRNNWQLILSLLLLANAC